MPQPKLTGILEHRCKPLAWAQIFERQVALHNMYAERFRHLKQPEVCWQQMTLAMLDEWQEYIDWLPKDRDEAALEAIDLYHFALEGYIVAGGKPTKPRLAKLFRAETVPYMLADSMQHFSWKHWKVPAAANLKKLRLAYLHLQDAAFTMFAMAKAEDRLDNDLEFRRFYTLKAKENVKRQRRGY